MLSPGRAGRDDTRSRGGRAHRRGSRAKRAWRSTMTNDNTYVNIYVSNNLGYGISRVWLAHKTSKTTWVECWMATDLGSGRTTQPNGWQCALVPRSTDYFTVMW